MTALACLIGSNVTATNAATSHSAPQAAMTPAHRTVIPRSGSYNGFDHAGNTVYLTFSGNEVRSFYVGGQSFGNAHVGSDFWDERCNNGWCFKGRWVSSTEVVGTWRHGSSSSQHPWSATVPTVPTYYQGSFRGYDHNGASIHVRWNGSHISGFTVNTFGDFPATTVNSSGQWHETCSRDWCYRGHFVNDYEIVGEWRTPGSTWYPWEAFAISS